MSTIFSKIIKEEIPAHKVAENEDYLAFLDVFPLVEGHVLVIPKNETDYIFDIEEEEYKGLWSFAKHVATGLKKAIPCTKVGVAVVGLEVAHAHIHLIPINNVSDMSFAREKLKLSNDQLAEIALSIRKQLS